MTPKSGSTVTTARCNKIAGNGLAGFDSPTGTTPEQFGIRQETMSMKEMQKHCGTRFWSPPSNGNVHASDIVVEVEVTDVRQVFDRTDCLITTKGGHGERWVGSTTLNHLPDELDELPA
jgi:hypothetical protein